MAKKKLQPTDYWAQYIVRTQSNGKDYIYALVRRKYSDDDIEPKGPGEYLGVGEEDRFEKITDSDPDSDTFGKRISKPDSQPTGKKLKYTLAYNKQNIDDFKKMCGAVGTPFGETRFYYKFKERTITAESSDEFWTLAWNEAHKRFIHGKQVIEIEQTNKHDNRPRSA
mgnify:FL=1|tara:strand:+ start:184 stop:687 length:504 start_codon:yes stop_codon:yes gene_type:complete